MLLVLAGARIADSCSGVSLRARGRYLGRELESCRDGHRRVGASSVRRSGKRMRQRTSGPRDGAEPTPARFRPFIPSLDGATPVAPWLLALILRDSPPPRAHRRP